MPVSSLVPLHLFDRFTQIFPRIRHIHFVCLYTRNIAASLHKCVLSQQKNACACLDKICSLMHAYLYKRTMSGRVSVEKTGERRTSYGFLDQTQLCHMFEKLARNGYFPGLVSATSGGSLVGYVVQGTWNMYFSRLSKEQLCLVFCCITCGSRHSCVEMKLGQVVVGVLLQFHLISCGISW